MTYYQRNRDVILNWAKDYYKNDKKRLREHREINIKTYQLKKKIKRENMEKTETICLKKKKQRLKEYQKNYFEANE